MMNFKMLYLRILEFFSVINRSYIGAFAAQSAFFVVISFFPLLMLILSFIKFLGFDVAEVYKYFEFGFAYPYEKITFPLISVGTVLAAWSSGRAFSSLRLGLNYILEISPENGYVRIKIRGILISLIFSLVLAFIAIIGTFGERYINIIFKSYDSFLDIVKVVDITRKIFLVFVMFLLTFLTYTFLPDWKKWESRGHKKLKNRYLMLISFCVSVSVYIYTDFFSIYVTYYADYGSIYKNMESLVCVMILIYGAMFTLILGFKISVIKFSNHLAGISNL